MSTIHKIKKRANSGRDIDVNKIYSILNNYNYVSFDVFDTLVKRNVEDPTDIFSIMERSVGNGFKEKRIEAEKKARTELGKKEISIEDIYSYIPLENKSELINLEIETEFKVIVPNLPIAALYEKCIDSGKTIYITSDMYWSEATVKKLLQENGFNGYKKIYLSSAEQKIKSDGSLFKFLLASEKIKPEELIHIGDSRKGDYFGPHKLRISAIHIPRYYKKSDYTYNLEDNQKAALLNCFINNTEPERLDKYQKFGYECFGPFLWGYVNWLYESIKKRGINKIFFFSRDGLIMKKAFDICFSDYDSAAESSYLEVSRRSLRVPILWMDCRFDTVLNMISPSKLIPLNTVFDGVGLNMDDYIELIAANGMHTSDVFDCSDIASNDKLLDLYEQLIPYIIENSKKEYDYLIKYIKQNELEGKFAIVDIGWSGGMQRYLEQTLSKLDISHEVVGFYTGVAAYYKRNAEVLPEININGYVFDFKNDKHAKDRRSGFVGLFESLFLEQGGSVKNYYEDGNTVKAARYDYEYIVNDKPTDEYLKIKSIQESALQFVRNASDSNLLRGLSFSSEELFSGIHQVGARPDKKAIELFADFNFYDEGETQKLAVPKGLFYYTLHPKAFKNEFLKSRWKIGFLKRMLKINLPYEKMYESMLRFK